MDAGKTEPQIESFPVLDSLVVVHYDNLRFEVLRENFVRGEVESRIERYLSLNKPVYNLSTIQNPFSREGIVQIASPGGDDKTNYDLDDQTEELLRQLKSSREIKNIEIIGVAWWQCVDAVKAALQQNGLGPVINYDCTDLAIDYAAMQRINASFNNGAMPTPHPDILERYKSLNGL